MRTISIDTEYEIWKPIFGHNKYEVSNTGKVRNSSGCLLKGYVRWGRILIDLYKNSIRRRTSIHTLVLETFFIGPLQQNVECAHLNGKEYDNRFVNLKWATHKENESHKRRHGTMLLGETRFGAKLNANMVREIRRLYVYGNGKELAVKFGVNATIISRVVNRRIWSHV